MPKWGGGGGGRCWIKDNKWLVELIKSSEQWGRKALSSILIEALNASIVKVQAINKLNNSSNDL